MTEQKEPWFEVRRSGYGLTPTTWQGWCVTLVIMAVLLASVQVVLYLVRDPANAVILILIVTAIELAVFIPFTYRHAKSPEEMEKEEVIALAGKRQQIKTDLEEWKKRNP
jgi:membrane protein YdbS with pleckstrin-like domain